MAFEKRIYNVTDTVSSRACFIWKIKDFSACPVSCGSSLRSKHFVFENVQCHLYAWNVNVIEEAGSYLIIPALSFRIYIWPGLETVTCVTSLKDQNDCLWYRKQILINKDISNVTDHTILNVPKAELPKFLINDCLTVVCKLMIPCVTHDSSHSEDVVPWKPADGLRDLSRDLGTLLTSKQNADVRFQVEGQEIPAHSLILSARSSVFAAMLQHNMAERHSGVIKIVDCCASTINCLLRYIYSGEKPEAGDLSPTLLTELYSAADKYAIVELKNMCYHIMASNLSEDNVKLYAPLAQKYNDQLLMESVVSFFAKNPKLVHSELWNDLTTKIPALADQVLKTLV